MRCDWSMRQILNNWDVYWMNQFHMRQENFRYIRSLVNARDLLLECARVLHETLLIAIE